MTGFIGAGTGVTVGALAAEWVSRSTGQDGWNACGVKAAVKGGVGLLAYGISTKLGPMRALSSFFAEMFAYGAWGSIFLDIAMAAYPGGIPGLAEDWAITARTMAAGGRKVVTELSRVQQTQNAAKQTVASQMF
jgi:MFS family permease